MQRKTNPIDRFSPLPSFPYPDTTTSSRQSSSSSDAKISPAVLLVIIILSIAFFVCGFLHLLIRFLIKRSTIYSFSLSGRYPENSVSDSLQRQLHHLFSLHDSGLDQHIIDALPVFCYKEIVGLKEPFDCAVCLNEFADQDQLRLLPVCSHAFHVNCIDTWLLSNSTCPLCRNSLVCSDQPTLESQFSIDSGSVHSVLDKPAIMEEESEGGERRVYSVRLGKYRSSNLSNSEESSSRNLGARRCYSMGSFEYVIGDSDLLVSLTDDTLQDVEAKRISNTSKGESFSVSKIWQWSKKGINVGNSGPFHFGLPLTNKVQDVADSV